MNLKLIHEYDEKGNHRLYVDKTIPKDTDWVPYRTPATCRVGARKFLAVTDYYNGSVEFPNSALVYEVKYVEKVDVVVLDYAAYDPHHNVEVAPVREPIFLQKQAD